MKLSIKKALTLLSIFAIIIVLLVHVSSVNAATAPTAKDKALAFIEDVIQPDMSKYNVTLVNDIVGQPLIWPPETQESVTYYLDDNGIGPDITCLFINNTLTSAELGVNEAFTHSSQADESLTLVYSNRSTNLTEETLGLLERYQTYTSENLQDMANTLTNVDAPHKT